MVTPFPAPEIQQPKKSSVGKELLALVGDIVQVVVLSFAIFMVTYIFVFQPNKVRGSSMVPTFLDGDYLLTDKVTYRWVRQPEQGDIVVFQSPENQNYDFIKRIMALPGDNIMVEDGRVYVNDQPLEENYLPDSVTTRSGAFLKEGIAYRVPENSYIVFGDNRNGSSDSREWGPVVREKIVGRAWFRYLPLTRVGLVNHEARHE